MPRPETKPSMSGAYQPQQPALRWLEERLPIGSLIHAEFVAYPTAQGHLEGRIDADVFYIGLGDQFDDDRRRVRAAMRPTSADVSSPAISADSR